MGSMVMVMLVWNDAYEKLTKHPEAEIPFSLNNSRTIQMLKLGQETATTGLILR